MWYRIYHSHFKISQVDVVDSLNPLELGYKEPEIILGWGADATVLDIGDQLACRIPKKETFDGDNGKKRIGEFQARALCKIRDSNDAQLQQATPIIKAYDPDSGTVLMSKVNSERCLEMFKNLNTDQIKGITVEQLTNFFTTIDKLTKLGIQLELRNANIFYNLCNGFKLIDMISIPGKEAPSQDFMLHELESWVDETIHQCQQAGRECSEIVNNLKTKIKEALTAISITKADLKLSRLPGLLDWN